MINYVKFDHPEVLVVANGGKEHIVGEGTVQVLLETGNSLFLFNVKHVPSASNRLLSVGKAFHDGFNVHINGIQCHLTDSNGDLIGIAEHVNPYQWLTDLSITEKHPLSDVGNADIAVQMPDVFSALDVMCPALHLGQDASLVSAGEHEVKDQGQQGPAPNGTKHGKTAAAGSIDTSDPEPIHLSVSEMVKINKLNNPAKQAEAQKHAGKYGAERKQRARIGHRRQNNECLRLRFCLYLLYSLETWLRGLPES